MSNAVYPSYLTSLLNSSAPDLTSTTIKAALLEGYSYNSAHDFYNDVSAYTIGTPSTIGSKTITGGQFSGIIATFSTVAIGHTITAIVLYRDTGTSSTSPLLAFINRHAASGSAISIVTTGGDIDLPYSGPFFTV